MANQQGQAFEDLRNTINECTRIVRLRWRLSIVGLALVGSVAFWCSQYLPREYTASTMFERRDDVVLQNLIRSNSPYGFEHLKATMKLDMTGSRALARALVAAGLLPADELTSQNALTDRERAALGRVVGQFSLKPRLRLVHSTDTLDTIVLECSANDPTIARRVVTALRDRYVADTRDRIRSILGGTKDFFGGEIHRLDQQVVAIEEQLRTRFAEFEGIDPSDLVGVGNRLELLRAQREDFYQRKATLEAEVFAREEFLRSTPEPYPFERDEAAATGLVGESSATVVARPPTTTVDQTIDKAVRDVQMQIVDLLTIKGMTMEHPQVRAYLARRDALEGLKLALADMGPPETIPVADATPVAAPPKVSEAFRVWEAQRLHVELDLQSMRRQLEVAVTQFTEADQRVSKLETLYNRMAEEDNELKRLLAQRTETRQELGVWQRHLSQLDRVLTAESGERGTQFAIIEDPQDVARPTQPRVASVFVVCSGLGLAAATLLVALAELFDRSFRSVGQVTRSLGVPVLECIGVIPTPRERRRALVRRAIWVPTLAVLLISLGTSATLAYASLEMPSMHRRALERVERVIGMAPTPTQPALMTAGQSG